MLDTVERAGAASAYQDDQLPDLRLAGGLVGVDRGEDRDRALELGHRLLAAVGGVEQRVRALRDASPQRGTLDPSPIDCLSTTR